MVAKGYSQVQGLDYNETFVVVARMESIILFLAVATSKRWEVHHMDVKISFLHGDLKEEIYMKKPEGFIEDPSSCHRNLKDTNKIAMFTCRRESDLCY